MLASRPSLVDQFVSAKRELLVLAKERSANVPNPLKRIPRRLARRENHPRKLQKSNSHLVLSTRLMNNHHVFVQHPKDVLLNSQNWLNLLSNQKLEFQWQNRLQRSDACVLTKFKRVQRLLLSHLQFTANAKVNNWEENVPKVFAHAQRFLLAIHLQNTHPVTSAIALSFLLSWCAKLIRKLVILLVDANTLPRSVHPINLLLLENAGVTPRTTLGDVIQRLERENASAHQNLSVKLEKESRETLVLAVEDLLPTW
jgi:hypothetical protein